MEKRVQEALDEIKRGTSEIIDIEAIEKLIKNRAKNQQQLDWRNFS